MNAVVRPLRSVLYIPGSKERALEKARTLPADAIIFDLEDAVAPDEKAHARSVLVAMLAEGGYGRRMRIVRINALGHHWGRRRCGPWRDGIATRCWCRRWKDPATSRRCAPSWVTGRSGR